MVTIFGIDTCFYCLRCKQLCQSLQIEHSYLNLSEPDNSEMFRSLFPGEGEIPQVLWEGERIGGYPELKSKIDEYINGEVK